jgi:OOP family OmpA-OmpF porin
MTYSTKSGLAFLAAALFVFAAVCATQAAEQVVTKTTTIATPYVAEDYVRTADNFVVLFDASGSKGETYKNTGRTKVELSKKVLRDQAATLPDLGFNAGIYLYTPWKASYPMQRYNKADFLRAVDSLPEASSQQPTPLGEAIMSLDPILARLSGKTTVFLFSDGQYTLKEQITSGPGTAQMVGYPVQAAKSIVDKYDDVCFFIISTATEPKQEESLRKLAALNACSRVVPLEQAAALSSCTAGALCTIIATEKMRRITMTKVVGMKVSSVLFGFDQSDIQFMYESDLDALGRFLQQHPDAYVVLSGYADSTGPEDYNMTLSKRRAEKIADYLEENFNINSDQIVTFWYGEANPVASNDAPAGRAKNRRVEIRVEGMG